MNYMLTAEEFNSAKQLLDIQSASKINLLEHEQRMREIDYQIMTEGYSDDIAVALYKKEFDVYREAEGGIIASIIDWLKGIINAILGRKPKTNDIPGDTEVTLNYKPNAFKKAAEDIVAGIKKLAVGTTASGDFSILGTGIKLTALAGGGTALKVIGEKIFEKVTLKKSEAETQQNEAISAATKVTTEISENSDSTKVVAKDEDKEITLGSIVKTLISWIGNQLKKVADAFMNTINTIREKLGLGSKDKDDKGEDGEAKGEEKPEDGEAKGEEKPEDGEAKPAPKDAQTGEVKKKTTEKNLGADIKKYGGNNGANEMKKLNMSIEGYGNELIKIRNVLEGDKAKYKNLADVYKGNDPEIGHKSRMIIAYLMGKKKNINSAIDETTKLRNQKGGKKGKDKYIFKEFAYDLIIDTAQFFAEMATGDFDDEFTYEYTEDNDIEITITMEASDFERLDLDINLLDETNSFYED